MSTPARESTFELQLHPAGAHGRIRYFRVTLVQLRALGALALLAALFVIIGLTLAPAALRRVLAGDGSAEARAEHARRLRELRSTVSDLSALEGRSRDQVLAAQRFVLAYGLEVPLAPALAEEPRPGGDAEALDPLRERGRRLLERLRRDGESVAAALAAVEAFQRENPTRVAATPSILPLATKRFVVTSPFGDRLNPFTRERETHAGLDLAAPVGTPVRVTADGTVLFAGLIEEGASTSSGWFRYGKLLIVEHAAGFVTIYGHLDEVRTAAGVRLRRGAVVGTVGNTGWTTHPHLHYEVRRRLRGELRPADPRAFFLGIPELEGDRTPSGRDLSKVLERDYEPLPAL